MHGKTRRGALIFDVADLFKDAIVMPLAFKLTNNKDQDFRDELIDFFWDIGIMNNIFDIVKETALTFSKD